ncbi:Ribosomal protein L27 [Trinorchestia longiramus]|nr:Ribosomal protein L27 [Trinorchestia longiramus]
MLQVLKNFIPSLSCNLSSRLQLPGLGGVLCARDTSSKSGRLRPHKKKYRYYGIKTPDSTFVTSGTNLAYQRGVVFFPGLNVGIRRNFTLFAMEHGRVFVTTEKTNPNWEHGFVKRLCDEFKDNDIPMYKTYLHVIPIPMPNKFKLVEQY